MFFAIKVMLLKQKSDLATSIHPVKQRKMWVTTAIHSSFSNSLQSSLAAISSLNAVTFKKKNLNAALENNGMSLVLLDNQGCFVLTELLFFAMEAYSICGSLV